MAVTITPLDLGTVAGDGTGDTAREGGTKINANEANIKAAVETLQSATTEGTAIISTGESADLVLTAVGDDSSVWQAAAGGDLVDDLTPQLGGDLDVNGKEIQSTADVTFQLGDAAGANKLSVQDSAGVEQFSVDTDTFLLNDQVLTLGIQAHWMQTKMMPQYQEMMVNYVKKMGAAIGRDGVRNTVGGTPQQFRRAPYTKTWVN